MQYVSNSGMPGLTVIYIAGHGHHWPGGELVLPKDMIGPVNDHLNATDTLWDFFKSIRPPAK